MSGNGRGGKPGKSGQLKQPGQSPQQGQQVPSQQPGQPSGMENRGRGRGRGRPKPPGSSTQGGNGSQGAPQAGAPPRRAPQPGGGEAQSRGAIPRQTFPRGPQEERAYTQRPVQQPEMVRPPAPTLSGDQSQSVGRGASLRTQTEEGRTGGNGNGGNQARGKHGEIRGRQVKIYTTKPESVTTKQGTSGNPVHLRVNYFRFQKKQNWHLNQYHITMAPDVEATSMRRKLFRDGFSSIAVGGYLFDGTHLYTPQYLERNPTELFVKDKNGENVRITIKLVGDLARGDYHYLQIFNIILRKCLTALGMELIGREYYFPQAEGRSTIGRYNIQLWPGYLTSTRQHEKEILINCDLKFKLLRTDTVYDMLLECQRDRRSHASSSGSGMEFKKRVTGQIVLTVYNNKTYRIDDVDFNSTPSSTFSRRDNSVTSYKAYFEEKYRVKIRDLNQPILVSRSTERERRAGKPELVCLIPELCRMTGLTDRQRENFNLMKEVAEHTRVDVRGRLAKLKEFADSMKSRQVIQELRTWDVGIADALVQLTGRVLNPEVLHVGNNIKIKGNDRADWTRDLRSKPPHNSVNLDRVGVICLPNVRDKAENFVKALKRVTGDMGIRMSNPKFFQATEDTTSGFIDGIDICLKDFTLQTPPNVIIVILPSNSLERYSNIKKRLCVDKPHPSQMILQRTIFNERGLMSIATKVGIQILCKVGGSPWAVTNPLPNMMVVGYDVCRDKSSVRKSFAGMVASLNPSLSRYYSVPYSQEDEEELSLHMGQFLVLACQAYKRTNNRYPDQIFIYRDGVGDGQIPYVRENELQNVLKQLQSTIYKCPPKVCFVIVSKRHNTRIFAGNDNPLPGTVVDDVITLPERYDFFLVPQCVNKGTVSPTNFNCIYDSTGLSPDRLQMLTYKMCHLYYNWSGTIRVPAPCQYAHKLAFLTAQCLKRKANSELETLLYYL